MNGIFTDYDNIAFGYFAAKNSTYAQRRRCMPRDIPIGNGSLLITFDKDYCIRDIYFPNIGMENHTEGHPFRFGVWVDGCFSWMGNG